ncbi:S1/P1 nuclease [Hymenobacter taeanensis]|uniref:S1/P1 nuclease n=1 Tax=Hymenobacter taeanensis TaxID=2735321 RepID=A0A6M6BLD1_9BACT|nr:MULTISPECIES: S1/P1 nuclease [Hymenobacter]QJX48802.1 S1/P1 nuclease [Hymenobacter taeanensis]UOQ81691.1 S1/P1 nuclease [Hymenobacter sp. 5414T-23]
MRKRILPLFLLLLSPLTLWAWGADGHRAVGKIAEQHLSRHARQEVQRLLGTETLTMVSTWPDEIRFYPEFKETAPWHYVNTPSGLTHDQYVQQLNAQTLPNAYNILEAKLKELKDPAKTQAEKVAALKFVVHIVGDVHQPLHAGHAEDKGGNDIKVQYRGKETNLHSLWDSGLIDYQGLTYTEMATQYDQRLHKRDVKALQKSAPEQWLWESYQACERLYKETPTGSDLNYTYYPQHAELMRQRIVEAGIRLAGVLNETFK